MIDDSKLETRVGELLEILYKKRFASLEALTLTKLLNKNPYLYCAIGINDPSEFINQLLLARVSSSDETIFGNDFLEPLALWSAKKSDLYIGEGCSVTVGSGAGQDIAIETAHAYLAISVKSGKNIFNSQSNKGQSTEFDELQFRLKKINKQFRRIIGYAYGRKINKTESTTERIAGQNFWELLTGESDYYLRIARAIAKFAESHSEAYKTRVAMKKLQLLREFMLNYVADDGRILWDAVVMFNSSKVQPRRNKAPTKPSSSDEIL